MYLIGQSRSCSPHGSSHCGMRTSFASRFSELLQRAERAEPAAIGAAPPEEQRRRDAEPEDEDQRVDQERVPAELRRQRIGEGEDVDDGKLRVGDPADPDQREGQEADAKPEDRPLAARQRHLEEEDSGEHAERRGQRADLELAVAPDPLPELRPSPPTRHRRRPPVGSRRRRPVPLTGREILLRQRVGQVEGQERLVQRADGALHQQLQPPRLGRIEAGIGRDAEEVELGEGRRTAQPRSRRRACVAGRGSGRSSSPWISWMRSKMPPRT